MPFFSRITSLFEQRAFRSIHKELSSSELFSALAIGLTTGTLGVLFDLSFAALIFSSSLSNFLSAGVGLVLLSVAVTRVTIALTSSYPGSVADLGTVPTVILAWSAGMVVREMPAAATSSEVLITVIVTLSLTSLLTGLFLYGIGVLGLGNAVRSLPYPVVGGFVASTGWLLVKGSFKVMTDHSFSMANMSLLVQSELIQWVPGLVLAVYLLAISRRHTHSLVMSSSIVAAIGLFYLLLLLIGSSAEQASVQGLTLGIPTFQTTWQLLHWTDFLHIHWHAILSQWMCSGTVVTITAITLLLNVRGMELVVTKKIDTNHELKVAGLANILIGLSGGILSFQSMNKSVLAYKMGGRTRLVTLVGAAVFVLLPVFGSPLLSYFPKSVLGGLLLYLGVSILSEWVYGAWTKLSRIDYGIVQIIWLVSGTVGFLQSLALGWTIALILLTWKRFSLHHL